MHILIRMFLLSLLVGQLGSLIVPESRMYLHDIVLIGLLTYSFVRILMRRSVILPKLTVPIVAFAAASVLSLLVNAHRFAPQDVATGGLYLFRWIAYAGIYAVVIQGFVPAFQWTRGLLWVGVGAGAAGLLQYMFYPDLRNLMYLGWDPHYYRLVSVFFDPNFAGIILVLAVLLSLHLWRLKKHPWIFSVALLEGIAVILTYSRSSYLALVVGLTVYVSSIKRRARTALWTVLILLLIFVYVPKPGGDTLRLDRMASTTSRIENWAYSAGLFQRSPVTGLGFSMLRYVGLGDEIWENSTEGVVSRSGAGIDNSLLFVAASTGIAGLAAYGWLLVRLLRATAARSRTAYATRGVFHAMLAAVIVHSMFVNSLFYPWVMLWLWVLAGVVESEERKGAVYRW